MFIYCTEQVYLLAITTVMQKLAFTAVHIKLFFLHHAFQSFLTEKQLVTLWLAKLLKA